MADPRTSPDGGEGKDQVRPFDRHALQATLADALRLTGEGDHPAGEADRKPDVASAGSPSEEAPAPSPTTRVNPFTRAATSEAARPERAPSPLSGLGRPVSPTAPSDPASPPRPAPRILGGGTLGGSGLGSGSLPSGGGLGIPGLGGDRNSSPLTPTVTERPTIPLRRPKPAEEKPAQAAEEVTPPPAPAAPPQSRMAAPIPAWSPTDDDILPTGAARRRGFRLKR